MKKKDEPGNNTTNIKKKDPSEPEKESDLQTKTNIKPQKRIKQKAVKNDEQKKDSNTEQNAKTDENINTAIKILKQIEKETGDKTNEKK